MHLNIHRRPQEKTPRDEWDNVIKTGPGKNML
jgi:hypothetical protein